MPDEEVLDSSSAAEVEAQAEPETQEEPAVEYELEDGTPCDQFGNPLEAAVETPAEPVVEPEKPKTEYRSPYEGAALSDADRENFTEAQIAAIERMFEKRLSQHEVARAQQSRAARELGIEEEALNALSPYLPQARASIPKEISGTKQGAVAEILMAVALDAEQNGFDLGKSLQKLTKATTPPVKEKVVERLAPSAVPAAPRANPTVKQVARRASPDSVAARALGGDSVLELIRNERKTYR